MGRPTTSGHGYWGFTVAAADLAATRAPLTDRHVPVDVVADSLVVAATHAAGAVVSFVAADAGADAADTS